MQFRMSRNLFRLFVSSKSQCLRRPFSTESLKNISNQQELQALNKSLQAIVLEKTQLKIVSDKILNSTSTSKNSVHLQKKLLFKLGWIVVCYKKLTTAFENDFLGDKDKFNLINDIVLDDLKNKTAEENIENEFFLLETIGFNVNLNREEEVN